MDRTCGRPAHITERVATSARNQPVPVYGETQFSTPNPTLTIWSTEQRDTALRGVLQPEMHDNKKIYEKLTLLISFSIVCSG